MSKFCIICGKEIPEGRLTILPNTKVCVKHSSASGYKAITTVNGEGDHTWNDITVMSTEMYDELNKKENKN